MSYSIQVVGDEVELHYEGRFLAGWRHDPARPEGMLPMWLVARMMEHAHQEGKQERSEEIAKLLRMPAKDVTRIAQGAQAEPVRGKMYVHEEGGEYELLGSSCGAGDSRGETRVVYRSTHTGQLYHRTPENFEGRMVPK